MGLLLALTGLDGSGKTTQIERLVLECRKNGMSVASIQLKAVEFVEKNNIIKKKIQEYILCNKIENSREIYNVGVALAYEKKVNDIVVPSVDANDLTILDRYRKSAMCFHYLRNELFTSVINIYDNLISPDLNVFLDLSPMDCHNRIMKRETQTPYETLEYLERAYGFYSSMKSRFTYIDASLQFDEVTKVILSKIYNIL